MKNTIIIASIIIFTFYVSISGLLVISGLLAQTWECRSPTERWEYIFPSYQLGCWLGEDIVNEELTQ